MVWAENSEPLEDGSRWIQDKQIKQFPEDRRFQKVGSVGGLEAMGAIAAPRLFKSPTNLGRFAPSHDCRNGRCAGGADGHRPSSRYGLRGELLGDRNRDRGHDRHCGTSKRGPRCMKTDFGRSPPKRVLPRVRPKSDGVSVHRGDNRRGHCAREPYGRSSCHERDRGFRDDGTF